MYERKLNDAKLNIESDEDVERKEGKKPEL